MAKGKTIPFVLGAGLGFVAGHFLAQLYWIWQRLHPIDVPRSLQMHTNQLEIGLSYSAAQKENGFQLQHTVENGIERIRCTPEQKRFETPILMLHGMWHGAWCWQPWQELLAAWGWESVAFSLPGHGCSPEQRPIRLCTLDYYLGFLKAEVQRLPVKPVLMGHSMGGALGQWYLKFVSDDLPAVVLVAPWVAHNALLDSAPLFFKIDPMVFPLIALDRSANPMVRNPRRAARVLLSKDATYSPDKLKSRLGSESALVMFQHNPPFWTPPENLRTPMLLLAGQADAVISLDGLRRSAAHYRADFVVVKGAAHNLMMERQHPQIAAVIHDWLAEHKIR
jgi:pimeloyl-ACP methyl ester carboxylesterase